ncbi:unnamed protein product [Lymnaea stagnalis]|uniref:small monomeric GTPase n=1 Tax=Lymnaea stagnalis TaxID=6523 RepID=A0AAV2HHF7_LYMST
MSSPVSSSRLLKKINIINSRTKPFRVVILGQNGVGKTALTVRFLTRRYIGDYDPSLERVYTCQRTIQGLPVDFEVWDTAGENENSKLKEQIRWADAIILMYDVTDRCSFNECSRLKFLVNALSRRRNKKSGVDPTSDLTNAVPVVLLGNKIDKARDRMVMTEEGMSRSRQLGCDYFQEVSVSETVEDIIAVFEDLYSYRRNDRRLTTAHGLSRSTLHVEKPAPCSSDEELEESGAGARPRGRRDTLSLPIKTLSDQQDELIMKSRSRRREAYFVIS